jgi:hypothetical protein
VSNELAATSGIKGATQMATAPQAGPQAVRNRNWKEIKAPEQFKWTRVGESVVGILLSIDPVTVKGKPNVEYLLQLENGERITMLETADLKKKIDPSLITCWLNIRYEKDQRFDGQDVDQSAMKIFKVMKGDKAEL